MWKIFPRLLLINFAWKFLGTVRFGNDHVAGILGFSDLQWGNILITRVYFVKGLGHNLFSVGKFCDSDLEVAFKRNACFVRNLDGVDLLKGDCSTNLYTINLHEMASASLICLMAHASSTKSWLWHQRLSHLNFDTINDLARNDLVRNDHVSGLLKFKYHKEHLCPLCKLVVPSNSESHVDCSNGDNACCSKHMTGNLKLFINFVSKFLGTIRFGNDHVAAILGFGQFCDSDLEVVFRRNACFVRNLEGVDLLKGDRSTNLYTINLHEMASASPICLMALASSTKVYFVEGLGHNLFSVVQLCDSDLEVAFRRNACFVRNLEGVDLLKGDRSTYLYTINLHEMVSASPICLMARASSTKSWLWHQRLSHLNFDTINDLTKNDLFAGLLKFKYHKEHLCPSCLSKFKYHKEHLCPSCEQGKSKRASHPPKPVLNSRQRLYLLHMDLCGPMRIASINGKQYILVIVDDYSRYTWIHFLRSKDEAPAVIITVLKRITVLLKSPIIIIRTDNGIEFKNQVLKVYFDSIGITHQMYYVRTPQQNGVVERQNRTLVEAARTMLIFSRAPLFLWAEAIATANSLF
nr:putative ribonuclease H-like domain-containing protein [Tanacetum cinerariifolium]